MNKILKTLITNFILGGLVVSIICVIADTYSYNLAGNLVGALPLLTTYMIFYAYAKSQSTETISNMIHNSSMAGVVYIIFCMSFAFIYPKLKSVYGSYFIALSIWILCQLILIYCIFRKQTNN